MVSGEGDTMPSSQKFPSGLNNWTGSDRPSRSDFVADNTLVDAFISGGGAGSGFVPTTRKVNNHALTQDVTVTKADVGLGNADNTSDANKPISTATQTALNAKLALAGGTMTGVLTASNPAVTTTGVRNIYAGTADMTAGTSSLVTGSLYVVYE